MSNKFIEFTHKGAKVALYPMNSVETVMIDVMIKAGSWDEVGKDWGALHLIEHLTMDANSRFSSKLRIEEYKETNGLSSNASTSGEYLEYYVSFPRMSYKPAITLLHEILFQPLFLPEDISLENQVILREYTDKWSSHDMRFMRAGKKQRYGRNHPYIRDGMGKPEYISSIDRETLLSLHKKFFVPNNMCVAIAGRVTEKRARSMVEVLFDEVEEGAKNVRSFPKISPQTKYMFHKEDIDRVLIEASFFIPGRDTLSIKEKLALNLARYIIGGSTRSLLFRELRLNTGLVYRTGCYIDYNPTDSSMIFWASTDYDSARKVKLLLSQTIYRFIENGVSKEEFERAKNYMNMRTMMLYDSPSNISDNAAGDLFYDGSVLSIDKALTIVATISQEYLLSILKKYIGPGKEYISIMARKDPELKD